MKNIKPLILILLITACHVEKQENTRSYIEPGDYIVASFKVKDTAFFSYCTPYFTDSAFISVRWDSVFHVTNELGRFLFDGSKFNYAIMSDTLNLKGEQSKHTLRLDELSPNSFRIILENHKYLHRITLLKPKDMRRKVTKEVKVEY